tara:strand:- start:429 stop:650 length:222 start_codon:yes stop_codon:yes gene_type:complete
MCLTTIIIFVHINAHINDIGLNPNINANKFHPKYSGSENIINAVANIAISAIKLAINNIKSVIILLILLLDTI